MAFVFASIGMFVHIVFMFKREWLFDKKRFRLMLIVGAVLFALSYVLILNNVGNPSFVRFLTVPLLSLGVFYVLNYVFFKIYNRNPEDTFWSMDWSQMRDGIFNFLFWVLGIMLPMFITYEVLP
jgi:hypothetical protein